MTPPSLFVLVFLLVWSLCSAIYDAERPDEDE